MEAGQIGNWGLTRKAAEPIRDHYIGQSPDGGGNFSMIAVIMPTPANRPSETSADYGAVEKLELPRGYPHKHLKLARLPFRHDRNVV